MPAIENKNPCQPSPCGLFSQCREVNGQAVCSCQPSYIGGPPNCRPECTINNDCEKTKTCVNQKCKDPCPGTCGTNANCKVFNHSPICSCIPGYTGDPFVRCYQIPRNILFYLFFFLKFKLNFIFLKQNFNFLAPEIKPTYAEPINPCFPSPCGPYSECRDIGGAPSCSCKSNYVGTPPNCRPECVINQECPFNKACIQGKCRDPCPGSCGFSAQCTILNHTPICTCAEGYTGDPFTNCVLKPPSKISFLILFSFFFFYQNSQFKKNQLQLFKLLKRPIHAILHHVVQMLIVIMEFAHVCLSIKVTHMLVADLNVF